MTNNFQSSWCQAICAKLDNFSWTAITLMSYEHALSDPKQQAAVLELQAYLRILPRASFWTTLHTFSNQPHTLVTLQFQNLEGPDSLPSHLKRDCIHGICYFEMMEYVILYCHLYADAHQELLSLFFTKHSGHPDLFYLKLLSEQFDFTSFIIA